MTYHCSMTMADGCTIKYDGDSGDYVVVSQEGEVIDSGHVYDPLEETVRSYLVQMNVTIW